MGLIDQIIEKAGPAAFAVWTDHHGSKRATYRHPDSRDRYASLTDQGNSVVFYDHFRYRDHVGADYGSSYIDRKTYLTAAGAVRYLRRNGYTN